MRDDFNSIVKGTLAKRVAFRCSNPDCCTPTSGPQSEPHGAINIGVAAHICAASRGGKRYDPNQSGSERSGIENGIWLCQNCAKLIDSDEIRFSVAILRKWKELAENAALMAVGNRSYSDNNAALALKSLDSRRPRGLQVYESELDDYENSQRTLRAQRLRAFYRPQFSIHSKSLQTDSITIVKLRNDGYFASNICVVFPLADRKIENMFTNKSEFDTDEVLRITLVGNLLVPFVSIQISISYNDITGRIYQQEFSKTGIHENLTSPELIDILKKPIKRAVLE
jgi:hypothetical protein